MLKIKEGKGTVKELFDLVDAEGNNSGTVDKEEFTFLAKRLGFTLSSHRIDEIYAKVK